MADDGQLQIPGGVRRLGLLVLLPGSVVKYGRIVHNDTISRVQ